ncbi:MAG: hypothetical protein EAZ14_08755 [Runella slithyformis]|nr:MAG: hypothetical protein EAZ46_05150 [Runella sp.]TAG18439.1 MAG: hypothetical protein EAZ38_14735 [Cytophagales bacterium]TAG39734.1 MAG: hypothetical protein EAZ32_08920 [Cytophagia bacterium]TAG50915.1 MAG: hypothetical protein EAZ29_11270 [Runella slithyformis]TAG79273.1 MAG: hypothetical protein EAZ22_11875 [Cytophagales bacterium]
MNSTMLIEVTNQKVIGLLRELEELSLIKVLKSNIAPTTTKLSKKYKGVFTKTEAQHFEQHTQQMRTEWDNT